MIIRITGEESMFQMGLQRQGVHVQRFSDGRDYGKRLAEKRCNSITSVQRMKGSFI